MTESVEAKHLAPYVERARALYEAGDYDALLSRAEGGLCACLGPRDGEPACPCRMWRLAVRRTYSVLVLRKKKLEATK